MAVASGLGRLSRVRSGAAAGAEICRFLGSKNIILVNEHETCMDRIRRQPPVGAPREGRGRRPPRRAAGASGADPGACGLMAAVEARFSQPEKESCDQ
ncbi:hypothetical protein GCM10010182_44170 [Actinomadura cremea]|nr:hypothetical protein GCM10010182_44170 [Actinomadura cremea]